MDNQKKVIIDKVIKLLELSSAYCHAVVQIIGIQVDLWSIYIHSCFLKENAYGAVYDFKRRPNKLCASCCVDIL